MAELNLKQIIDRLNAEFIGDNRKLVFWYDDKVEFVSCLLTETYWTSDMMRIIGIKSSGASDL